MWMIEMSCGRVVVVGSAVGAAAGIAAGAVQVWCVNVRAEAGMERTWRQLAVLWLQLP